MQKRNRPLRIERRTIRTAIERSTAELRPAPIWLKESTYISCILLMETGVPFPKILVKKTLAQNACFENKIISYYFLSDPR